MPESEQRKRREQMILQARERVLLALGNTLMTASAHHDLMGALDRLYVEWSNAFTEVHAAWITEQLERAGVMCDVHHTSPLTAGDWFPTEYRISHGAVMSATSPTFDMALVSFIERLLSQAEFGHPLKGRE